MNTEYVGMFVKQHNDGTIYAVTVQDIQGNQKDLDPQDYWRQVIQPPLEAFLALAQRTSEDHAKS